MKLKFTIGSHDYAYDVQSYKEQGPEVKKIQDESDKC